MQRQHFEIIWPGGEEQVKQFYSLFLSQLSNSQAACLPILLFARRKYEPRLPDHEYILKRVFIDQRKTTDDVCRELLKLHVSKLSSFF